jgi:DNA gyrase subunit A
MGRATQGVTLIAVEDGTKLSGLQRVVETDIDEVELEPGPDGKPVDVPVADAPAADDASADDASADDASADDNPAE